MGTSFPVTSVLIHLRPPPTQPATSPGEINRQENEDAGNAHRRVQSGAQHKIEFGPPAYPPSSNEDPKQESYDSPAAIVHPRSGREVVQAPNE